jgi:hypothetical protein
MQTFVFLLDVDDTLLDNDAIKEDWEKQLQAEFGSRLATRFWNLYEQVRICPPCFTMNCSTFDSIGEGSASYGLVCSPPLGLIQRSKV